MIYCALNYFIYIIYVYINIVLRLIFTFKDCNIDVSCDLDWFILSIAISFDLKSSCVPATSHNALYNVIGSASILI
jgi:hypothetical protein